MGSGSATASSKTKASPSRKFLTLELSRNGGNGVISFFAADVDIPDEVRMLMNVAPLRLLVEEKCVSCREEAPLEAIIFLYDELKELGYSWD